jgi:hypothetical protein
MGPSLRKFCEVCESGILHRYSVLRLLERLAETGDFGQQELHVGIDVGLILPPLLYLIETCGGVVRGDGLDKY